MNASFACRPGRLAGRLLVIALTWLLAGCATLAPVPPIEPLLHDALFGHPPRPAEADRVFALDDAMRTYLRQMPSSPSRHSGRAWALADALYTDGELRLDYDASVTRTAAQAFAARSGNCLSLVVMTAALARELGLEVRYQAARIDDAISRDGGLTLRSGHVNLVLGPQRPPHAGRLVLLDDAFDDTVQIDFLPTQDLRGLRTVAISEDLVLAMFMNNRAVEALLQQRPAEAYAWAREALRQAPRYWAAYNTLGVVYQRAGHLTPAVAVFEQVLAQDADNLAAIGNLAQALQAQGRDAEAAVWAARREALEPVPPFVHLRRGQEAVARGDFDTALTEFGRERRVSGGSHELSFWVARAWFGLGEAARAQDALRQAMALAPTPRQQALYAGKLNWLRAHAAP